MNELECYSGWPDKTREYVAAPIILLVLLVVTQIVGIVEWWFIPATRVALTLPYQRASIDALRNHVRMLIRANDVAYRTLPCSDQQ